ncbi:helicase-associated domain-containing protein [Desulfobacterales bacterium HSG2]|nr:helicase-associated domain-containing protein [Desulfobacterales bacterium HSG2]
MMKETNEQLGSLYKMFDQYTLDELAKICSKLNTLLKKAGIKPDKTPTRKADRVNWMGTYLKDGEVLEYLYHEHLSDLERSAVQEAVHDEYARLDRDLFEAKYGDVPTTTFSSYAYGYYGMDKKKASFPLLIFFLNGEMMPKDMQRHLKAFVPKPPDVEAPSVDQLPESVELRFYGENKTVPLVRHSTEQAAINDLTALLQLVDMGKVSVSAKTGKPTKSCIKALWKILSNGDFYPEDLEAPDKYDVQMGDAGIRPFAWVMLLQAANLAKISGTKLELSRTGRTAMQKPAHDILAKLWERWIKTKILHEMSRIDMIKGQKSRRRPLFAAENGREKIADALSELNEGEWIKIADFFNFLIAKGHRFNIVRDDWSLYIGDANHGSLGYDHVTWEHINGRFARAFLLEYAATLGLIDVALVQPWGAVTDHESLWGADDYYCLSRYDGLRALRLNSLGAWILGQKEAYTPVFHDEPSLRILPNLEITSTASRGTVSDELFLDRFCERTSERVWRMSLPKLLQAVEEGVELTTIADFLRDRNPGKLPQPVQVFLDDASDRVGRVQDMGEARLVKCTGKSLARLIANDTSLKKLCIRAGENYLVVPKEKEKPFRTALRKLGYVLNMQGG